MQATPEQNQRTLRTRIPTESNLESPLTAEHKQFRETGSFINFWPSLG